MNPKLLFYLLDIVAYPLIIIFAMWVAGYVNFGGSDAAGQGMAAGFGALFFALIGILLCFVVSLVVSSKWLGTCWPAVIVFLLLIVVLCLIWSLLE